MQHRTGLMLTFWVISLSAGIAVAGEQSVPCYDSDGDGWADPEVASDSCPPDNCPGLYNFDQSACSNFGDPFTDGVIDVLDVVKTVGIAFRDEMPALDSACEAILLGGTDVNCDSATDVLDVVQVINVAFRNATADFCKPCECDCYPILCSADTGTTVNLLPNNGSFERHCDSSLNGWTYVSSPYYTRLLREPAPNGGVWSLFLWASWAPCGWAEHELPAPAPGGIYRVNTYYRARMPAASVRVGAGLASSMVHITGKLNVFQMDRGFRLG